MTRWFTSDLHLGDPWTTKMRYCGDDIAKHDAWLAKRWDANIGPDDEVWLLGDIAVKISDEEVGEWLAARPGTKHLVLGNHDDKREVSKWEVSTVWKHPTLILNDDSVVELCHYPNCAHSTKGQAALLLHGHTHKRVKASRGEDGILRVHVGWEAWRRYIPEKDIVTAIREAGNLSG